MNRIAIGTIRVHVFAILLNVLVVVGCMELRDRPLNTLANMDSLKLIADSAHFYASHSLYKKADIFFDSAIILAVRSNKTKLAKLHYDQGLNSIELGQFAKALEHLKKMILILERDSGSVHLSNAYYNIGIVYSKLENYQKALDYLQKAEENGTLPLDEKKLLQIRRALLYINLQNLAQAKFELARCIGDGLEPSDSLFMAKFHYAEGTLEYRSNDFIAAAKSFEKAATIAKARSLDRIWIECTLLLNEIRINSPASPTLEATLCDLEERAEHCTFNDLLLKIYDQLAHFYLAKRDYASGTHYQEKFIALRDKLFGDETLHKLSALHVEFEERHQVRRIQQQKELMELQQEALAQEQMLNIIIATICLLLLIILAMLVKTYRDKRHLNRNLDRIVQEKTAALEREYLQMYESNKDLESKIREAASDFRAPIATLKGICHLAKMDPETRQSRNEYEKIEMLLDEINISVEPLTKINSTKEFEV